MNKHFLKSKTKLLLLAGITNILLLFCGCMGKSESRSRVLWPPFDPKVEFIATYTSKNDLPKSKFSKALDNILGKPEFAFQRPFDVTIADDGRLLISDSHRGQIHIIDFQQSTISHLERAVQLFKPMGITTDKATRLYVVDNYKHKVLVFDRNFVFKFAFGENQLTSPTYIAIDDNNGQVYVTDVKTHTVEVFDLNGTLIRTIGALGRGPGQFFSPQGLTVDREGRLFVADTLNARIQVFDKDGNLLYQFGQRGTEKSQVEMPKDIAIDSEGHLYIIDARRGSFSIFRTDGKLLLTVGSNAPTFYPHGIALPNSIAIDQNDRIFITDAVARRLSVWQYLGSEPASLTSKLQ